MNNFPKNPICHVKSILKKKRRPEISRSALVDTLPIFPGGKKAFLKYCDQKLTKPKADYPVKNIGSVHLTFVIDRQGKPGDVRILKSLNFACNYEAFRLVKNMPIWQPAIRNEKSISFRLSLSIDF